MNNYVQRYLVAALRLPDDAGPSVIRARIAELRSRPKATKVSARRAPYATTTRDAGRLGYGTPERAPTFEPVTPAVGARSDGWGRKLVPHPRGGYITAADAEGSSSASRGTARFEDEALPSEWFEPSGHVRVRAC